MDPRAKDVFLDALEQPAGTRRDWVVQHCADLAVREQVLALLAAHDIAPTLASPAIEREKSTAAQTRSTPAEKVDDIIDGRYQLIRRLGEGGFGEVFLARQQEPVVRDVAIKILKSGVSSRQVVLRFEAEQQTLALMDHPQIARVFDAGTTAATLRPYFVMEYVAGVPITDYCLQHGLDLQDRLELIEQVCHAIQHAHQKGVIHRDLKPGNILVTEVDGKPTPKVIDFGIAKAIEDSDVIPSMTLEAQIIGTPQYMSPEQATLGKKNIDTRSDVYSLGTVLYELIAGVPPFDPQEMRIAGLEKICQIVRERAPSKPSTRITTIAESRTALATKLSRQVSGEIDWIIMKALEKEPGRRYQSAAELAADIRRYIEHEPVLAGPPSSVYQIRKFVRRHRLAVGAAAVVAVALVAATLVSSVMAQRARAAEAIAVNESQRAHRAEQAAVAEADNARRELRRATAIVDFTKDLLDGIGPSVARGRDTTLLKDLMGRAIDKSSTRFNDDPRLKMLVQDLIGSALYDLGDYATSRSVVETQFKSLDAATGGSEWLKAGITYAKLLATEDKYDDALAVIDQTIAGGEAGQLEPEVLLQAMMTKAVLFVQTGDFEQSRALAQRAVDGYSKLGKLDTRAGLQARNGVVMAKYGMGLIPEVANDWKAIADDMLRILGEDDTSTLNITGNLASVLMDLGRNDEADFYYQRVMTLAGKVFEPGHPVYVSHLLNYSEFLLAHDRALEAEPIIELAAAHLDKAANPQLAWSVNLQKAKLVEALGRWDEMLQMALENHADYEKRFGHPDRRTFGSYASVIRAYTGKGDTDAALKFVADLGNDYLPADADPRSIYMFNTALARLHLKRGDLAQAVAYRDQVLALEVKTFSGEPYTHWTFRELQSNLEKAGATSQPATRPTTAPASTLPVTQTTR